MKRLLNILLVAAGTIGLIVSLAFSVRESAKLPCSRIDIQVDDHLTGNFFVTKKDVMEMILSKGDSLIGRPISSIPIAAYERHIEADPSVKNAEVYTKHGGILGIKVYQRVPILRVMNTEGDSYYIDQDGYLMPTNENFTARVPVATGHITDKQYVMQRYNVASMGDSLKNVSVLDDLYQLAAFIRNDPFWNVQIQQIVVEDNGELTVIPTIGDHHILLGTSQDLAQKFNKLKLFYRKGLNKTGWEQYSRINLKFKDQVICTKKNS